VDRVGTKHIKTGGKPTTDDPKSTEGQNKSAAEGVRSLRQEGAAQAIAPFSIKAYGVEVAVHGAVFHLRKKTATRRRRKKGTEVWRSLDGKIETDGVSWSSGIREPVRRGVIPGISFRVAD